MIGLEEVATHPMRHVLTGALGTKGGRTKVDLRGMRLVDGDQILLSTDGFDRDDAGRQNRGRVGSRWIIERCVPALIDQALAAGGKDNVTVVLGRYLDQGESLRLRAQAQIATHA